MKTIRRRRISPFILMAFATIALNSCKQDELIVKTDPAISWSNPADITTDPFTLDALIGSTQLNARASVPGTFIYTPNIGSNLKLGDNQDLRVDFIPTDNVNFNPVSDTVKINVKAPSIGTVADIDGNVYNTVIIGTQVWMVENLRTTKYNDGTPIPYADGSEWFTAGAVYCWYNNDSSAYKNTYGALYSGLVVFIESNGNKNVCPIGWHVPSLDEWSVLITFLGDEDAAGGKMKQSQPSDWIEPENGSTNESGFTALPGGMLSSNFVDFNYESIYMKTGGFWRSSTIDDWSGHPFSLTISNNKPFAHIQASEIISGMSIRCIKD